MGDCEIKPDPETGRVVAPAQCPAGANNGYQAPANVANPPVTNPNQAPANAANPPPTGKKSRKMKRTPEQQRVVKRYLEEEVGPMFNMVPLVLSLLGFSTRMIRMLILDIVATNQPLHPRHPGE